MGSELLFMPPNYKMKANPAKGSKRRAALQPANRGPFSNGFPTPLPCLYFLNSVAIAHQIICSSIHHKCGLIGSEA